MDEFIMEELLEGPDSPWDSSSSEDEDEIPRKVATRIRNYMDVLESYSNKEFKEHFRLNRNTLQGLIDGFGRTLPQFKGGWPSITAKKAVYMTVWYLANMESFRQVSDRFNVTISSTHRVILAVVNYLVEVSPQHIKWPTLEEAAEEEKQFHKKKGLHHVIGAIDGSHLKIRKPKENEADYVNRKGYHSILLQGIVNSKKIFINVKAGEPGSMHDSRMLRRSIIYNLAEENYNLYFFEKYCLLGDSAYPSLRWLVTPHKDNGHLTEQEREYNYKHSASRITIEHAFGMLKGRFRRIRYSENLNINVVTKFVVAACVLHNMCTYKM